MTTGNESKETCHKALSDYTVKELVQLVEQRPHFTHDVLTVIAAKYFELDHSWSAANRENHELKQYIEKVQHDRALLVLPTPDPESDGFADFVESLKHGGVFTLPDTMSIERLDRFTFNGYQDEASRTANGNGGFDRELTNYGLGIAGEAGEVADLIKKCVFHQHDLSTDEIVKELGDVLWYIANIARLTGVPLEMVARRNIEKLKERYPDGFSIAASRDRKE